MRLYLDEDLDPLIAGLPRDRGVDAVSAHERNATGMPDGGQLDLAAEEGRCLVTANRDDFVRLTAERLATRGPHAGVLIVTHRLLLRSPASVAAAVARFVRAYTQGLPPYAVVFVGLTDTAG